MSPKEFEKIVSRIVSIMVDSGSEVVWNDKIPDPDNLKQMRQIDISINHNGLKSHIECRHHSAPQDVKWIEELIGRKLSLEAFTMVAVSSSGFTEGATKKAETHGIFLHTLTEHSSELAHTWGRRSKLEIGYYGFYPLDIHLVFNELPKANLQEVVNAFRVKNDFIDTIFNKLKYAINGNEEVKDFPYDLQVEGYAGCMDLLDRSIEKFKIKATTYFMKEVVELPSLMTFSQSSHDYQDLARVERSDVHNSEMIFAGSRVKIQIDITKILNIESNKIFSGHIDLGLRQKTQIPEIKCIGSADHEISLYDVGLSVSDLFGNVL
ncbi:restriction endonuclease [Psychrobacter sp. DAB_AL43B]|uniref:restriction endonuclease n=1 Tax=Psychrobacter sp. DAB_AL43B TaxID=1028416 RepID=UPI0009A86246|nr:restriction endonuclease [Psychrobacter sp. DAB_AL43B]SLJ83472.1 hypothetical protein DABAL43B_0254 [Psychrobacter sp. DAB_AL43B]